MSPRKVRISIEGMHCPSCAQAVESALEKIDGLTGIRVDYARGEASFTILKPVPFSAIRSAIEAAGYRTFEKKSVRAQKRASSTRGAVAVVILVLGAYVLLEKTGLLSKLNFFPQAGADTGYAALFSIGIMTSFHCIAMCGGINLAQSTMAVKNGQSVLWPNILYNLGRMVSYTLLGGVIGQVGKTLSMTGALKAAVSLFAGAFMIIMALNMLGLFPVLRWLQPRIPKALSDKLHASKKGKSSFYIGLVNGLMPCGPLQSMQLFALSSGSFFAGAKAMFLFSAGTVPLMLAFGLFSGKLNRKFAGKMMVASAALVLLLGAGMMQNGLALSGVSFFSGTSGGAASQATVEESVQMVTSEVDYASYSPIVVKTGVPVRWTLHVPEGKLIGCNNEIIVPALGITQTLSEGDTVIEFTPTQSGTYVFSCWMGMIRSSITVVDDLASAAQTDQSRITENRALTDAFPSGGCCCAPGASVSAPEVY